MRTGFGHEVVSVWPFYILPPNRELLASCDPISFHDAFRTHADQSLIRTVSAHTCALDDATAAIRVYNPGAT